MRFKIIDNEIWLESCLRCNCHLENSDGERIFCWDCWIYLKDKAPSEKQLLIDIFILMEHDEIVGNVKKHLMQPTYLPPRHQENVYYEDPFAIITYKSKTNKLLISVEACYKITGRVVLYDQLTIQHLEDTVIPFLKKTKIEDALPIDVSDYLMKRFGKK